VLVPSMTGLASVSVAIMPPEECRNIHATGEHSGRQLEGRW